MDEGYFAHEVQGPNSANTEKMPKVLQKFHKQVALRYAIRGQQWL